MNSAELYIDRLKLIPHPEGGYFREVYCSNGKITNDALPEYYSGDRSYSTSIYFLLVGDQKSHLHKLKSDEVWHFYDGSTIRLFVIDKKGSLSEILIGRNIEEGEVLQYVIEKDQWFCAEVKDKKSFSLIGCTVSPGFDFSDFELGSSEKLLNYFPLHKELIKKFTLG
jgi:predicted cupin superfamily sugar epimerase